MGHFLLTSPNSQIFEGKHFEKCWFDCEGVLFGETKLQLTPGNIFQNMASFIFK